MPLLSSSLRTPSRKQSGPNQVLYSKISHSSTGPKVLLSISNKWFVLLPSQPRCGNAKGSANSPPLNRILKSPNKPLRTGQSRRFGVWNLSVSLCVFLYIPGMFRCCEDFPTSPSKYCTLKLIERVGNGPPIWVPSVENFHIPLYISEMWEAAVVFGRQR